MAKKKRTAKRSTKAGKRRPSTKRVAAKGKGGAFQSRAFQGLPPPASQQELSPAVQSTQGVIEPLPAAVSDAPLEERAVSDAPLEERIDARLQDVSNMRADAIVIPAPVPITPTVYPDSPQGTITVQNHITINIQSAEFGRFDKNLEALISELLGSNEISGEVRDQLVCELWAGREIIGAPKPQHDLIDFLLVRPLIWLIENSGSAMISKLAGDALVWLIKMLH
jgi:hypothetical protein